MRGGKENRIGTGKKEKENKRKSFLIQISSQYKLLFHSSLYMCIYIHIQLQFSSVAQSCLTLRLFGTA